MTKKKTDRSTRSVKQSKSIQKQFARVIDWLVYWSGSKYAPDKKSDQRKLNKSINALQAIYRESR